MTDENQNSTRRDGCLVLILAALILYQILFALRVLMDSGLYGNSLSLSPFVQAGMALIWVILLSIMLVSLVRHKRYAVGYNVWLILSFVVYSVLRIVFFVQADYERNRIPFLLVVTIVTLIVPVLILLRRDKRAT